MCKLEKYYVVVNHILARVYGVSWGKGEGRPDS